MAHPRENGSHGTPRRIFYESTNRRRPPSLRLGAPEWCTGGPALARAVKYREAFLPREKPQMTPLSKTFLAFMAVALVVGGTLALRSSPSPAAAPAQLT